MQQGHDMGERHPDYEARRPLPEEMRHRLAPRTCTALEHPTRRGILRELQRDTSKFRTPEDLQPLFPGASRATIAYHLGVLYECGGVTMSLIPSQRGSVRSFSSGVAGDVEFELALAASEPLDLRA